MAIRILLADDHVIVTQGIEALLKPRFDIVGRVRDGSALVAAVERLSPDLVVTEISMPGLDAVEAIRRIKASKPGTAVIVLTSHAESNLVAAALKAGASGYLLKISSAQELQSAIDAVLKGRTYLTSLVAKDVFSLLMDGGASDVDSLSPRQREILRLIVEGRTMKEVASALNISRRTAETHKYEIMNRLGCKTVADLILRSIKTK